MLETGYWSPRIGVPGLQSPRKAFGNGLSTVAWCSRPLLPSAPAGPCRSEESPQELERVLLSQWGHRRGSEPTCPRARKPVTHCCVEMRVAETAFEDRHFFGSGGGGGGDGVSYRNAVPLTPLLIL